MTFKLGVPLLSSFASTSLTSSRRAMPPAQLVGIEPACQPPGQAPPDLAAPGRSQGRTRPPDHATAADTNGSASARAQVTLERQTAGLNSSNYFPIRAGRFPLTSVTQSKDKFRADG